MTSDFIDFEFGQYKKIVGFYGAFTEQSIEQLGFITLDQFCVNVQIRKAQLNEAKYAEKQLLESGWNIVYLFAFLILFTVVIFFCSYGAVQAYRYCVDR